MSDNSLNSALTAMTPPSRLSRRHQTANRMHPKWSENHPVDPNNNNNNNNALQRDLFTPTKTTATQVQVATPLRAKTPQRNYRTTPKRSNSGEYCGLTAEITRELHRSVTKTPKQPVKCAVEEETAVMSSGYVAFGMQTPPRTNRKTDIFKPQGELALAPTLSSSYSDDISPKEDVPPATTPAVQKTSASQQQLPPSSSKAKRSISTPLRMKNKLFSAKKIKQCLTPPREGFASHLKQLRKKNQDYEEAPPSPCSLSTALPGADEFKIHSTEYDPFDFQCELPTKKEMGVHAKICGVVDSYTAIHRNFNFAMLAGLTRSTLEKEYERSTVDKPMIAGACHRDVVKGVLDCAEDLVVEGFFREYVGESAGSEGATGCAGRTPGKAVNAKDDRIEAVIFSSEMLRQIIVCFRGSTASQAKPLKINYFGKEGSALLHQDHQVRTLAAFRDAYFGTPMEETLFALLANLATRKPFFDVVITGHSFGAALATIGAMRYATANPMMRVSCHVFGCPRIGGEEWRQLVHSVANLKVFRVENASDPYVVLPSGSEWVQVGHAISIHETTSENGGSTATSSSVQFTASRFDRDRITSNNGMFDLIKCPKVNLPLGMSQSITTQGKIDHEMKSYVEKLTHSGEKWFTDFVGMNGNGVISFADNERRLLA